MNLKVFLQRSLMRKNLSAPLAGVRLLPSVRPHVRLKVVQLCKRPLALATAVRLYGQVYLPMLIQGTVKSKRFATVTTEVRLNVRVELTVLAQLGRPSKPTVTQRADQGTLAGVLAHVVFEERRLSEPVAAFGADKRLFVRVVRADVVGEVRSLNELEAAFVALVGLFATVDAEVRVEDVLLGEAHAAVVAHERPVARVRHLVALQHVQIREGPVADRTIEALLGLRGLRGDVSN